MKLKTIFKLCTLLLIVSSCEKNSDTLTYTWNHTVDRTWAGKNFWANRLQDWEVSNGKLVCKERSEKKPMRTLHLVTSRLENPGNFTTSVQTGLTTSNSSINKEAATGFLIGAGASIDYRAAALIHHSPGKEGGFFVGVNLNNNLFIQDFNSIEKTILANKAIGTIPDSFRLKVSGLQNETQYQLNISIYNDSDKEIGQLSYAIDESKIKGNIALVSHPGKGNTGAFWYNNWMISGEKFDHNEYHRSGPIITAQHTISNEVLKINAQLMPLGNEDNQTVILEIKPKDTWEEIGRSTIQKKSYNALFRIENFNYKTDIPYRLSYNLKDDQSIYYYKGTFRANPTHKDTIIVAGFTGNHNLAKGVERAPFNWQEQVWYPHNQLVDHVKKQNPDILFFSGDQIYEGASPSGMDRAHKFEDYLYKWYLWCWAYSDVTKDLPTVTIPDDHDVFQGNVWGNGGGITDIDSKGGYVHGIEFVKMVERTQVSHLPDPFDPTPIKGGIGVYYTTLNLGRISFAIIEDRKFKSGPNGLVTPTKSGRPDHVIDPNYTYAMADVPGATLLGDRQIKYLDHWAGDWKNSDMKVVLSQTIFGNMATHHGPGLKHLYMDFDSNGWPQTGRNRALKSIRKGFGFMLAGDQHLATIVNHGIDEQNDAGWSFCVPSIANFYPRAWQPFVKKGNNHMEGLQDYTGEYLDGLGNKVNVYAHTNPGPKSGIKPEALHDRMPGYGIVKLTKSSRDITMECWPRYVDPTDTSTGTQYPGWPKTINMEDNYARKAYKWLPEIRVSDVNNPVIQVIHEDSGEIIYTLRIKGKHYRPKVFKEGTYTIVVSEPDTNLRKTYTGLIPHEEKRKDSLNLELN